MASSGMFVIAVQTFSSNNFNTVKEKILERMLFCLSIIWLNENQYKPLPRGLVFPDVRDSQNVFRQSWSHFKLWEQNEEDFAQKKRFLNAVRSILLRNHLNETYLSKVRLHGKIFLSRLKNAFWDKY